MNILLTGGAGYLGTVLVERLLCEKHHVAVLDNFMYGQTGLIDLLEHPQLEVVRGDAREGATLRPLLKNADVIIPLAALVGAPACETNRDTAIATNLNAINTLLSLASREQLILFPNTNSGYGIGEPEALCTEASPLRPVSLYGRLKVQAEENLLRFHPYSVVFRFATLFGLSRRMRLDLMVNDFCYRAVHDKALVLFEGDFRRNFLHVQDAAACFCFAIEHIGQMKGQVWNAGRPSANMTKRALCDRIAVHVPEFVYQDVETSKDPDQRDYVVSNSKLLNLGWRPQHTLDDGIAELVKAFCALPFANSYRNA